MDNLKIIKATYYDPQIGVEYGADVTDELSAEIVDDKLFYNGIYNFIFPDPFIGKSKKLKVEIERSGKNFTKFYNENEKINLPHDLGGTSGSNTSNKGRVAVRMTESARNNVFINSHIHGGVEISGQGNSFIETKINAFKKEHTFWFWFATLGTLIGIITGSMFLAQYFGILSNSWGDNLPLISASENVATTTPSISDLFSKALSYESVAERQDFLGKYVGKQIYGRGVIEEVSRAGERFLVDIDLGKVSIVCPQEKTDVLEEQYPFLKGKQIMLYGVFTYTTIFGHGDNISIEPCSFSLN